MSADRHYSPADRFLLQADAALRTLLPFSGHPGARPLPSSSPTPSSARLTPATWPA